MGLNVIIFLNLDVKGVLSVWKKGMDLAGWLRHDGKIFYIVDIRAIKFIISGIID
jgi:hypothetical protein